MRVLLGLGDAQLLEARFRHDLAERLVGPLRREHGREQRIELLRILRHAERRGEPHHLAALEVRKFRIEQRRQDLADAVGAEIRRHQPVAVLHAGIVADHGGLDELVAFAARIGGFDRALRVARFLALRFDQRAIRQFLAIPPLIAVHAEIAAADRAEAEPLQVLGCGGEARDEIERALGWRVAAVEEGVTHHRNAGGIEQLRQCRHVILMRMHAARRQQAKEMRGAAALFQLGDKAGERLVLGQRTAGDRLVDARQILHHDAPGAEIHVPDLGVAHLAAGQADERLARLEQCVRTIAQETMPVRRLRQGDGIVGALAAMAPAIEDTQHNGPRAGSRAGRRICTSHRGNSKGTPPENK